jgi:hypothetical protein
MARIKIHVDKNAETEITIEGTCGTACEQLVRPLAQHLGRTKSEELTTDYFTALEQDSEKTHTH